jgi:hypothetical protein
MNADTLAHAVHDFQCANSELLACALVYGVAHPALYPEFIQWFGADCTDYRLALIFDARPQEGNLQYGPFLVRLAKGASQPSKLLSKLAEYCATDFHGISFLFSSLDFEQLAQALRERLDVQCEDRSEWQMKFFDTRSLPVLDQVLLDEQRASFFGITKEWWYTDRAGELRRIHGEGVTSDNYQGPLRLSEQQAKIFIDASLPDSVLYALSHTDSDLLTEFDRQTRYEICERSLMETNNDERDSMLLLTERVRAALMRTLDAR